MKQQVSRKNLHNKYVNRVIYVCTIQFYWPIGDNISKYVVGSFFNKLSGRFAQMADGYLCTYLLDFSM